METVDPAAVWHCRLGGANSIQQHPSAAGNWERKEHSLQDTSYLHHSALHGRALAEWLFVTELQSVEKPEKTPTRRIRMERGLKKSS